MPPTQPARRTIHRTRIRWGRVAGLLVVIAATAAVVGQQLPASSQSPAASPADVLPREHGAPLGKPDVAPRRVRGGDHLDPDLSAALRRAAAAAASDGVEISVTSGWRSPQHQQQLLDDAVSKYGSEAEAARWVATPATSPHVSGDAVDVGSAGAAWLSEHGAVYGLCRIYGNEPWHYELRPQAVGHGCPPVYADPTHDPRMQR